MNAPLRTAKLPAPQAVQTGAARWRDVPALVALRRRLFSEGGHFRTPAHQFHETLWSALNDHASRRNWRGGPTRLLWVDGIVAGYGVVQFGHLQSTQHIARLELGVDANFRGRGLGRTLLEDMLDFAAAVPGCRRIELNVRADNPAAIRLYERVGFVLEGRRHEALKTNDGTYTDELLMAYRIL